MKKILVGVGGIFLATALLWAQEDGGPDHYKVRPGAKVASLQLHAEPKLTSKVLAQVPLQTTCLRNMGCQGGLTMAEFTKLSAAEKKKRAAENPRWCKVDYQGTVGWMLGDLLAEGACPAAPKLTMGVAPVKGSIQGSQDMKYTLLASKGEKLKITMKATNPSTYFNVTAPGAQEALFNGSVSGDTFSATAEQTGEYQVVVYLMRNAARRNVRSSYTLSFGDSPAASSTKPEVWPAKFNSTGTFKCSVGSAALNKECTFRVVRKRGGDGTEVWIQNVDPTSAVKYRLLRYANKGFTTNGGAKATAIRKDDNWQVQVGQEHYFIPDAAIFGG